MDDNAASRRILTAFAKQAGFDARSAAGGIQALRLLREAKASGAPLEVLLANAGMSQMDGYTLAEHVRNDDAIRIPVMVMIASPDLGGAAARCRAAGISRYLVKPLMPGDLLDAVPEALAARESSGEAAVTQPASEGPVPGLSVLLAEDNPINQRVARGLLAKRGHRVTVASTGLEAVEASGRESFDVVLMDVQMPTMDGLQAAATIRHRERSTGGRLPIIAMTAHAMKGDRERCLEAGMDGYVTKPIRPGELFEAIAECTRRIA